MKNKAEIFEKLVTILHKEFEIARSLMAPDSNLYTDLDLDSIDTVDLVIRLQEITGKRIEPETFKSVRTIEDVVDAIESLIKVG
jgi:acyl carrier protein